MAPMQPDSGPSLHAHRRKRRLQAWLGVAALLVVALVVVGIVTLTGNRATTAEDGCIGLTCQIPKVTLPTLATLPPITAPAPSTTAATTATTTLPDRNVGGCMIVANPTETHHTICNTHVDLTGLSLRGLDLSYADLSIALLGQMDLRGGVSLRHAVLSGATLSHSDLTGADLSYADLTNVDLAGTTLTGTTWLATICPSGELSNSNCTTNPAIHQGSTDQGGF
jgi:hypothetical protein